MPRQNSTQVVIVLHLSEEQIHLLEMAQKVQVGERIGITDYSAREGVTPLGFFTTKSIQSNENGVFISAAPQ